MEEIIIELKNISIGYGKKIIAKNINVEICENDYIGLVGPNGAGKTTLLHTLLGILSPIKGKLIKDQLRFGYVPQRDTVQPLLPYNVFDVVMMGRYPLMKTLQRPKDNDINIVKECLTKVGISHLENQLYNNLSGGQRQRTLIARALAVEPDILILDEPTNGMDTPSHHSLLTLINQLHKDKHLTIILVSHLLSDVANGVNKLILLDENYFQFGKIEDVLSEDNLKKAYSSDFIVRKINNEYIITSK